MSDDSQEQIGSDDQNTEDVTTELEQASGPTIESLMAELEAAKAEAAKKETILERARKGEKYAKRSKEELAAKLAELEEGGDWKAKYEEIVAQSNASALNSAVLTACGDTVIDPKAFAKFVVDSQRVKVVDGVVDTKSLEAAIAAIKEEYPAQIKVVDIPEPKRSGENTPQSGFEKEMRAAKTNNEILAVLAKYHKN